VDALEVVSRLVDHDVEVAGAVVQKQPLEGGPHEVELAARALRHGGLERAKRDGGEAAEKVLAVLRRRLFGDGVVRGHVGGLPREAVPSELTFVHAHESGRVASEIVTFGIPVHDEPILALDGGDGDDAECGKTIHVELREGAGED
jgi:hypothetical protein